MVTTTSYTVQGMTCDHCVRSIEEEVAMVPGVTEARADLATGSLTVATDGEPDRVAVGAAVHEAGYELAS
jgi:copper chaperone CopZ